MPRYFRILLTCAVTACGLACGDDGGGTPPSMDGTATDGAGAGANDGSGSTDSAGGGNSDNSGNSDNGGNSNSDGSADDGSMMGAAGAGGAAGGDPTDALLDAFGISQSCDFIGSPFGHTGTATIRGEGTLPEGLDPGYQLNLLIGADGFFSGVLGDNLFDIVSVCDTPTFKYEITGVDAGEWTLEVEVLNPDEPDDSLATVYQARGDATITVAAGQEVQQDVSFTTP